MDSIYSADDLAFRDEVRAFLRENLPERTKRQTALGPTRVSKEQTREWHKILYNRGWIAPNWPVEQGGTGWSPFFFLLRDPAVNDHEGPDLQGTYSAQGVFSVGFAQ